MATRRWSDWSWWGTWHARPYDQQCSYTTVQEARPLNGVLGRLVQIPGTLRVQLLQPYSSDGYFGHYANYHLTGAATTPIDGITPDGQIATGDVEAGVTVVGVATIQAWLCRSTHVSWLGTSPNLDPSSSEMGQAHCSSHADVPKSFCAHWDGSCRWILST